MELKIDAIQNDAVPGISPESTHLKGGCVHFG
jgi:hypothetical protein